MHACISVLFALAASTVAYEVTQPTLANGWTTTGPNIIKWNQNSTDRLNFTAVLTNTNPSLMPNGDQVLAALISGSLGQVTANPPSAGWPAGTGFMVNLVQDADTLGSILAQSDMFNITAPNVTTSSSNIATPTVTNAAAAPTDTTRTLQPAGLTDGAGATDVATAMRLGMVGMSGLLLMHLL